MTFSKIEHASYHVYFRTYLSANRVLGVLKLEQPSGKCNGSIRTERAGNNRTVYPSWAESVLPETALISVALACKQAFCGTWTPSHTVTWSHREPVLRLIGSTYDLHLLTDRSGNQFWQLVPSAKLEKVNECALHFVFLTKNKCRTVNCLIK